VKPRIPATIDTKKKINAHLRIVIAHHSSLRAAGPAALTKIADVTSRDGTGSTDEASGLEIAAWPCRQLFHHAIIGPC
jgi:hypothetical protein